MLANSIDALQFYMQHLQKVDYAFFLFVLGGLFILFVVSFVLLMKKPFLGFLSVILLIVLAFISPFMVKNYINENYRQNDINVTAEQQLKFVHAYIINAKITNKAKKDFQKCRVYSAFFNTSSNKYKQEFYHLQAKYRKKQTTNKPLAQGENQDIRIVYDNFIKPENMKLEVHAECY